MLEIKRTVSNISDKTSKAFSRLKYSNSLNGRRAKAHLQFMKLEY